MKNNNVKTAILPVAGRGTRMMPFTLHQPKGMIGVVDRPIVHYVIDEVIAAGIKHIVLVTGPSQPQFKQYLSYLKKDPEWKKVKFDFAIQEKPLGNGHAILSAKRFVKNKPFLLLWSDDILVPIPGKKPAMRTMIDVFKHFNEPVIGLERIEKKQVTRFGIVEAEKIPKKKDIYQIFDIVEKPSIKEAPSTLAAMGRYLVTPQIMKILEDLLKKKHFVGGELWLVDAIRLYIKEGGKVYGWKYPNERMDCGVKSGLLKAQIYFGLHHKEYKSEMRKYLKKISS